MIKPKSTNFGLGISIFQQGVTDRDDFAKAVEIAFREDKEIMVEDYLLGTEYRFFVLGLSLIHILLVFMLTVRALLNNMCNGHQHN